MEDALKKLDNLTQEEARMVIAENLRATHAVDERVRGVTEQVLAVDKRVVNVDERVASVADKVASVNDNVAEVLHGVQIVFRQSRCVPNPELLRRKGNKPSCETSRTSVIS